MTKGTTKAKKRKDSAKKKESTSKSKIIPNIKPYLVHLLASAFENETLQFTASKSIESLANTGDIKHLRTLSTIPSIYLEKIFWKQLNEWNYYAYDGDKNAELLLETVFKGSRNAIITYKSKRTGRPPKSLPHEIAIVDEYFKLQEGLLKNAVEDGQKKEISKYYSDLDNGKVSKNDKVLAKQIQANIERRKRNLTAFLRKEKLEISNTKVDKMLLNSNSEISIEILASRHGVGTRKIKGLLAKEDPDYKYVVDFYSPGSTTKRIDYIKYRVERVKARQESNDDDSYYRILSKKLGVPVKTLKEQNPHIHPTTVRTPHISRVSSKSPSKK